jgi:hypothetical protein
VIVDNNSKFGTLILLRKNYKIEKKKIALQIGRTVITFSLKNSSSINNNIPMFKGPVSMENLGKFQSPKGGKTTSTTQPKPSLVPLNKHKNIVVAMPQESEKQEPFNLNGSFLD